jgi:hypothetical protein
MSVELAAAEPSCRHVAAGGQTAVDAGQFAVELVGQVAGVRMV